MKSTLESPNEDYDEIIVLLSPLARDPKEEAPPHLTTDVINIISRFNNLPRSVLSKRFIDENVYDDDTPRTPIEAMAIHPRSRRSLAEIPGQPGDSAAYYEVLKSNHPLPESSRAIEPRENGERRKSSETRIRPGKRKLSPSYWRPSQKRRSECYVDIPMDPVLPARRHKKAIRWTVNVRRCKFFSVVCQPEEGHPKFLKVSTVGSGVAVAASSIPEAGMGLFASREFRRGELVTEYVGRVVSRSEAQELLDAGEFHYLGTLINGLYEIDGLQEPIVGKGGASFINHARYPQANVVWAHVEDQRACFRRMFAKALRPIESGEEIFLDYGKSYWQRHNKWKVAMEAIDEQEHDYLSEPNKPPPPNKAAPPPNKAAPSPNKAAPPPNKEAPSPNKAAPSPNKAAPPPNKAAPPPNKAAPPPNKAAPPPKSA